MPSPADPPLARADTYSPFRDPLNAELTFAESQIARELTGARCPGFRLLSLPAEAASSVGPHYARALGPGWQALPLTPPPGMTISAFRKGGDYFAAAVSRMPQDGRIAVVVVTTTVWDRDSAERRQRCLAA